jgi:hypothetical protein
MSTDTKTTTPTAKPGGLRTRHITLGIGLPIQSTALAVMHYLCGSGFFDNPITYTSILTAAIGAIDFVKNSGKN